MSGCPNAHPEGRNGVEHSEALRRVVRAGSRGTICPQRGKLDQSFFSAEMERSGMTASPQLPSFIRPGETYLNREQLSGES
jgi:hypothetical protein